MLVPSADLQANIRKVLSAGAPPLAPAKIAKALPVGGRPSVEELESVLAQMASVGLLERVPGATDKYVATPVSVWARAALLAGLAAGPAPAAALKRSLTAHYEHLAPDLLAQLLADGEIFRHPALSPGGKTILALTPADPLPYVARALDALLAAVAEKGFSPAAVKAAALRHLGLVAARPSAIAVERPPPAAASVPDTPHEPPATATHRERAAVKSSPDAIIAAMSRIEPRVNEGAAVGLVRLREVLAADYDKPRFDEAILALARGGIIELQSHAWPARLTAEERSLLIDNGRGGWFDSAALQRRRTG